MIIQRIPIHLKILLHLNKSGRAKTGWRKNGQAQSSPKENTFARWCNGAKAQRLCNAMARYRSGAVAIRRTGALEQWRDCASKACRQRRVPETCNPETLVARMPAQMLE
jgi:hypothetical protein